MSTVLAKELLFLEKKYSGMEVSQLNQLREMEKELAQYKKILAKQTLQITALKDVIDKKL
ncbi:hypothetical protein [Sphingobacterium hotanense]|uniref:Transposase n=1 Tax=Sphingobacterium hotanense TaxID=649196 RepID=A0ABT7NL39_9SPHI|nr:hypothetical protein [Sphingobacterium hotanense]MDM1047952.1 hypothetical protein [Sphingobacterium hotanense]